MVFIEQASANTVNMLPRGETLGAKRIVLAAINTRAKAH
jgi:hypothetical protein